MLVRLSYHRVLVVEPPRPVTPPTPANVGAPRPSGEDKRLVSSLFRLVSSEVSKLALERVELFHLPPAFFPSAAHSISIICLDCTRAIWRINSSKRLGSLVAFARLCLRTAGGFISPTTPPPCPPAFPCFSLSPGLAGQDRLWRDSSLRGSSLTNRHVDKRAVTSLSRDTRVLEYWHVYLCVNRHSKS